MRRDYSDHEVKALILDWLVRHGRWGSHYFPIDTLVNKLSHAVKNNGKRIRKFVRELVKENYLLLHKGGETVSLNPHKNIDILEYIRKVLKV